MDRFRRTAGRLLDGASRVAGADARYVARGTFWLSAAQLISAASAFALSVLFARYMAQETFGAYKYALSLAGIFAAISLTGLSTAVSTAAARGHRGALVQGARLALRWNLLAGAVSIGCGVYYLAQGNGTLGWALVAIGATQPAVDALGLVFAYLSGQKLFRARAAFTLAHTAVYTLVVGAAIVSTGSATAAIVAGIAGNLAGYGALFLYARRRGIAPDDGDADPSLPGYAKHLSLMGVLGSISGQIDKVLLFQVLGPAQVAMWSFAQAPVGQVRQISKVLSGVILPKVAATPLEDLRRSAWRRAGGIFAVSAVAYAAYWFVAPHFFAIFFPTYADAVGASRIYALAILTTPVVLFKQSLIGHRKTRELYVVNGAQPAIKIALVAASLPWGIVGIAAANAAAEFVNLGLSAALFRRASRPRTR
jgi:O-antigen/teichoic acid export membrane protein